MEIIAPNRGVIIIGQLRYQSVRLSETTSIVSDVRKRVKNCVP